MNHSHVIEPLESRVAPATLTGQILTYTDIDGDQVSITISKGTLAPTMFTFDTGAVDGDNSLPQQLQRIDFTALSDAEGANVTMKVKKAGAGDGLAAVGFINANGKTLGTISIKGDLGQFEGGSGVAGSVAVKSITARTLGAYGLATQSVTGDLEWNIFGEVGAITVGGDFKDVRINVFNGGLGTLTIKGSLIGGDGAYSGAVGTIGGFGSIKIGGDIRGGSGVGSGLLSTEGDMGPVSIRGSVIGSTGTESGEIRAVGKMGLVKIGGDLRSGLGSFSGRIDAFADLDGLVIGKSLIGGEGTQVFALRDAQVFIGGDAGPVKIGGEIRGGNGESSGSIKSNGALESVKVKGSVSGGTGIASGKIESVGAMGAITIGGSLRGGSAIESGSIWSTGGMGVVNVRGDLLGGDGDNSGGIDTVGALASLTVRGSIIGDDGSFFRSDGMIIHEGQVFATGDIGPVKVGGHVIGRDGGAGGQIRTDASMASVTIGGSLIGGAGGAGGHLCTEVNMGSVRIGGDIVGGSVIFTGWIESFGTLGNVTIGGSVIGGSDFLTGAITSIGDMGVVKIGRDLIGGSISGTQTSISDTGLIASYGGRIPAVIIGGSVIAGVDASTAGVLRWSGSIRAGDDIGALVVKGSVIGNVRPEGTTLVTLSAVGSAAPTSTQDLAFGRISIGGRVEHAQILAGYLEIPTNGNAQIGTVKVGGDWVASSLIAGVQDVDADGFGDGDETVIGGGASISRIASITIKGIVAGIGVPGKFHGFMAHEIGSFKSLGFKAPLTEGLDVVALSPITGDVTIREV